MLAKNQSYNFKVRKVGKKVENNKTTFTCINIKLCNILVLTFQITGNLLRLCELYKSYFLSCVILLEESHKQNIVPKFSYY